MADLCRITVPFANLLDRPDGGLQRQLLFGEAFQVDTVQNGWAKGMRPYDQYEGYILEADLAEWTTPTHRIEAFGAHVYPVPDIKTVPRFRLPFQAEVTVIKEQSEFMELASDGYVHQCHLMPIDHLEPDYVATAKRFLDVPYLWGGNTQYGLDCSGLISAAMRAAGIPCAADSADQEKTLGETVASDTPLRRGDIVFWKGHVGLMADSDVLLHANAHHMKVVLEPFQVACDRIHAAGVGPVTSVKRLIR